MPNTVKRVLHIIREACKELRIDTEIEGKKEIERKKGAGKQAADDFALFDLNLKKLNEKIGGKLISRKTTVSSTQLSRSMTTSSAHSPQISFKSDDKAQKKLKK